MISEDGLLGKVLDWSWAILIGILGWLWIHLHSTDKSVADKLATMNTRLSLLEQHWVTIESKMSEFDNRRREDRLEIIANINRHHEIIYKKLDLLAERLPK